MVADPALAHALVRLVRDGARLKTANGQIEFDRVGVIPQDEPLEDTIEDTPCIEWNGFDKPGSY